jgi:hypothetical protein
MVSVSVIQWLLLVTVNVKAHFLTSDYLQQAYLITEENALVKFDSTGKKLYTYHQNRYGPLRFADATNPMKLVLSYPDYGIVVLLDNTLSELSVTSLKLLGILNYSAVCFSSLDNNIWVFDSDTYQFKKFDRNGNIVLASTDMLLQLGETISPVYMQEENQLLFVSDTSRGILIFDSYGAYYETLPFKGVKSFQVKGDRIFFRQGNYLHSYQLKTLEEKDIELPPLPEAREVRVENKRLYVLAPDDFSIYRY